MLRRYIFPLFKVALWLGAVLGIVGGLLHYFFVQRIEITHSAMAPTLLYGEQALLWKGASLDFGDIAVCRHPGQPGTWVVGRVVGLPGTTVEADRNGQLLVDGTALARDWQGEMRFYDPVEDRLEWMRYGTMKFGDYAEYGFFVKKKGRFTMRSTKVQEGLFLLSDNLTAVGHDSRAFGEVDPAQCLGQIFMRWRPADDYGAGLGHGWLDWLL